MVAIKALVGPGRYAAYFPLNEYEPLQVLGLQAPEPMVTADGHGNFESAGFERALGFYLDTIRSGLAPAWTSTQVANVWDEFDRSEEHTSELQSLMRISYAVFCLKKKK